MGFIIGGMSMSINWDAINWFSENELECKCGCQSLKKGKATINLELITKLDELRDRCGFALRVNSALRCAKHNSNPKVGGHPTSAHVDTGEGCMAVDIVVDRAKGRIVLQHALEMDCFEGIGLAQSGKGSRFIHLDIKPRGGNKALWTYS